MAVTLTTTPTYTAAEAFAFAQQVIVDASYQFTSTRDKAARLIISYNQGAAMPLTVRKSTVNDTEYIVWNDTGDWNQIQDSLEETPYSHPDAIRSVKSRTSDEGAYILYPSGPENVSWLWDSESGKLTVSDYNRFYRVSYWYKSTLIFEDLTESTDYYARVFLTDYLGGSDQYNYEDGTVSETAFTKRFMPDYDTDTSLFDIDPNYGSAGNVFTNVLRAFYLSYTGVNVEMSDFGDDTGTSSGSGESSETEEGAGTEGRVRDFDPSDPTFKNGERPEDFVGSRFEASPEDEPDEDGLDEDGEIYDF